jgi:hypothetical protein
MARRMAISTSAPSYETIPFARVPAAAMPRAPAAQSPMRDPTTPTTTFAISPIWALVFMMRLARPMTPPMTMAQ